MKYYLSLFFLYINFFSFYAQHNKKPFIIQINAGIPFELPHKSILKNNSIPSTKQFDLRFQKHITQDFFLNVELQRSESNLKKDFMKTFQNELYQDETVINYINFPIYRGLFNVGFSKKNKKENREAAIALGVGLQKYAIKEDILLAHSALEFRNIKNKEVDYTNPLLQLTIENTWYIHNFGINVGIKTQYAKLNKPIVYTETLIMEYFNYKIVETESSNKNCVTMTPTLGIRYVFGNSKNKENELQK
jgi:hypothetical protein